MDKEVLEVVLKKCARDLNVVKVLSVEGAPALPKGENYTSNILRLKLKVVLGNGRVAKRSLIIKQIITKETTGKWLEERNVAKAEVEIYSSIHKEMTFLMEEFEDSSDTLWCNLIFYDLESAIIVLEDLKPCGYKLVPRQKGLDLEHTTLALTGLGRYHGMAKVLEEQGHISKDSYQGYMMLTDDMLIESIFYRGLKNTAKVIKERWDPCWAEVADKIAELTCEKVSAKLKVLSIPEESEFTVLNHGDCWSNNMMFKYDWRDRPISVKFLDYQVPHYNTPCIDVTNFMYASIQPAVRRENFDLLIRTYYNSLVRTLEKFGYSGTKPTLDEINRTMDRLSFFGLGFFAFGHACMTSAGTDALDLEKLLETKGVEGYNTNALCEPGMVERMGPDLIDFVQKHLEHL